MDLFDYYQAKRPRSYESNWHHKWVCNVLQRAYTERKNVICEISPRHGKSEIANVHAPAWWLQDQGHYDSMVGLITNSDNLATKFSVGCKNLCELPLEVDRDSQWKVKGLDSLNFTYMAAGIRGQITGHAFDTLILDDLIKSGAEAKSDTVRENVWENIVSAAINRLTPDGVIIALQARLHHQDTIGKLLELDHLKFLHLHLPATNDSGTEGFFRDGYSGEETVFPAYSALWPTRYSRTKLDEIKATVTPYYWNAQYQGVPSMGELAYFVVDRMPTYKSTQVEACWIAVDAAQSSNIGGSYTAFVCLGIEAGQLKVISVVRGRWRQDEIHRQLLEFYQCMSRYTGVTPTAVVVEMAAAGYGIRDMLHTQLPIVEIYPHGSKEDRAGAVCSRVNTGQVALPESGSWLKAFKEELKNFPLCASKDMTDAFVHALAFASLPGEFRLPAEHGVVEYDPVEEDYDSSFREENQFDRLMSGNGF